MSADTTDDGSKVSELTDADEAELDSGLTFSVVEGDSYGEDGERERTVTRREAHEAATADDGDDIAEWLAGQWPTAAELVERDLGATEELVRVSIPGWFANLDDNGDLSRSLRRATSWDGYDGATPSLWAVRDTDQDDGKGAYCLTSLRTADGRWVEPPVDYRMLWVARSCARLATVEGEPTTFDAERVSPSDAYPDDLDVGERIDAEPDVGLAFEAARERVRADLRGDAAVLLGEVGDRLEAEYSEDLTSHVIGAALDAYREATGGGDLEAADLATALRAAEAALQHVEGVGDD